MSLLLTNEIIRPKPPTFRGTNKSSPLGTGLVFATPFLHDNGVTQGDVLDVIGGLTNSTTTGSGISMEFDEMGWSLRHDGAGSTRLGNFNYDMDSHGEYSSFVMYAKAMGAPGSYDAILNGDTNDNPIFGYHTTNGFQLYDGGQIFTVTNVITQDRYQSIVLNTRASASAGQWECWIDGDLVSSGSFNWTHTATGFMFGGDGSDSAMNARLNYFLYYSRWLGASEVAALVKDPYVWMERDQEIIFISAAGGVSATAGVAVLDFIAQPSRSVAAKAGVATLDFIAQPSRAVSVKAGVAVLDFNAHSSRAWVAPTAEAAVLDFIAQPSRSVAAKAQVPVLDFIATDAAASIPGGPVQATAGVAVVDFVATQARSVAAKAQVAVLDFIAPDSAASLPFPKADAGVAVLDFVASPARSVAAKAQVATLDFVATGATAASGLVPRIIAIDSYYPDIVSGDSFYPDIVEGDSFL